MKTRTLQKYCALNRSKRQHIEWVSYILLLGASFFLSAYVFNADRALAQTVESLRLQCQARAIDENLRHQVQAIRGALVNLRAKWESDEPIDVSSLDTIRATMPGVRSLLILNAEGTVLLASGSTKAARIELQSLVTRVRNSGTLYIAAKDVQQIAEASSALGVLLSLGAHNTAGEQKVVFVAEVDASYFDIVMRSVLYATDMRSAILDGRAGGVLLYAPRGIGRMDLRTSLPSRAFDMHARSGQMTSSFWVKSDGSEDERLVVQRDFSPEILQLETPLTIAISRSANAISRPWVRLISVYFSAWAIVSLLVAGALLAAQRRRQNVERTASYWFREQQNHAARIELALAGADLGMWDWHLPSGVRILNERGASMLGYSPDEISTISAFYEDVHPDDADAVNAALGRHLKGETPSYEAEFRIRHRLDCWVWVHSRGKVVEWSAAGTPLRVMGTRMDITDRKITEAKVHRLAFYDGLTLLPNRRLLIERLEDALAKSGRSCQHGAVLFLDLDHFKELNDTLGHDMGDQLLKSVGQRLVDVVRSGDTVARLGGDEFFILLQDLSCDGQAARQMVEGVGAKILRSLALPHHLGSHELYSTPSIGATLFSDARNTVDNLLKQADLAMYDAKAGGRDMLRFFDPFMQQRVCESVALEEEIRLALPRQDFTLHYQPIVDVAGRFSGFEALVRWTHPQRGSIRPDEFIPLAEKTGLILPLGHWVLEEACRQLVLWASNSCMRHWTVAVNVSARQFRQLDFVNQVLDTLHRTGANASRLKLELTESMLLEDIDDVVAKMEALQAHGVGFSLDDFGTGYSSLSYLKKLPLSQLKIDRSFVADVLVNPNDAAIARAIIALAKSLGLSVVAEGVETEAQRVFLVEIGCTFFQGYLFGRPAPPLCEVPSSAAQAALPPA
jgi:diguanylate cyclase (GGDEF)-like protein/PAS domain S-box-containing protein